MSLSSVSLSEDSAGDAPISREVQTAPLTQQDQSGHMGVMIRMRSVSQNISPLRESELWRETKSEKVS